jgi:nucleotide-binding universal stress UspA family protein
MTSFRHVLVPMDLSKASAAALELGRSLARACGAELNLLHVYPYGFTLAAIDMPYLPQIVPLDDRTRRSIVDALATMAGGTEPADRAVRVLVEDGDPSTEILRFIREEAVDLVVMGAHGRRGFHRFLLGSVTERVAENAACSVLVVRGEASDPFAMGGGIVCAVDATHVARTTVEVAADLARATHTALTLLHVVDAPEREGVRLEGDEPEYPLTPSPADRLLGEAVSFREAGVACSTRIVGGRPPEAVLRAAREQGGDLLIMGMGGADGGDARRLGATVRYMVSQAPMPVLLVRCSRVEDGAGGGREEQGADALLPKV